MKEMKQKILRKLLIWALFILVFAAIFFNAQNILVRQRIVAVNSEMADLETAYRVYRENPGQVDVCYVGSSPVYAGISPMAVWGESGITGLNFGISTQTAMLCYFQVKTLLDMQKPKLVVVDLCGLFEPRSVNEEAYQNTYRSMVYTMPGFRNKAELITAILAENEKMGTLVDYFPFFSLHSQWGQIRPNSRPSRPDYFRGGLLSDQKYAAVDLPEGYVERMSRGSADAYALGYYEKLFSLCRENGVEVLAITIPKNEISWTGERIETCRAICEDNGIQYIDFTSPRELEALSLNREEDFYNQGHLGTRGAMKFSRALGRKLQEMYDLEDHREDPAYADWQRDYEAFYSVYGEQFEAAAVD